MLSRNQLKYIASITMLIDHIGIVFLGNYPTYYKIARLIIGRIAFLVFLFLFVDGFSRIKNYKRHIIDLLVIAIITEPIYDKTLYKHLIYFEHQNIMWTWLLCYLLLLLITKIEKYDKFSKLDKITFISASIFIFCCVAYITKVGYTFLAIIGCVIFYYSKKWSKLINPVLFAIYYSLLGYLLSVPILCLYNKDKKCKYSKIMKYCFYAFYPVHLLLLLIIKTLWR